MKRRPGVFYEAIRKMESGLAIEITHLDLIKKRLCFHQVFKEGEGEEKINSIRLAIRALKILDRAEVEPWGPYGDLLDTPSTMKLAALLVRARKEKK